MQYFISYSIFMLEAPRSSRSYWHEHYVVGMLLGNEADIELTFSNIVAYASTLANLGGYIENIDPIVLKWSPHLVFMELNYVVMSLFSFCLCNLHKKNSNNNVNLNDNQLNLKIIGQGLNAIHAKPFLHNKHGWTVL